MAFYRRYAVLLSAIALVLILVVLLTSPASTLSPGGTFIGSDLTGTGGDEVHVRTKIDLSDAEALSEFPKQFGVWQGEDASQSEIDDMRETLGADVVLLRDYERAGLYQPLDVLVMQAETDVSFRPLATCYVAHGYDVVEEGKETVSMSGNGWTEGQDLSLPLSRMVAVRQREGEVYQRLVVLYFYLRGNQLSGDAVTMLRVQALATPAGSYSGILSMQKDFIAEAVPLLFEPDERAGWRPLAVRLAGVGAGGYLAMALLLLIPVAIAVYPRLRSEERQTGATS